MHFGMVHILDAVLTDKSLFSYTWHILILSFKMTMILALLFQDFSFHVHTRATSYVSIVDLLQDLVFHFLALITEIMTIAKGLDF